MSSPTGILFYDPRAKPLSTNGQFQPGCYLLFYGTGTTTLANVYADGGLTTPLSQTPGTSPPSCTAASDGRFVPIYLDPSVIYRVQLYTSVGILLSDTDPYVPLPIPTPILILIADIAALEAEVAALETAVSALQTGTAWTSITGIPATIVALAGATVGGAGTFWNGATFTAPSLSGSLIAKAISADVGGIGSSFTAVVSGVPVTPGMTYSGHFEDTLVAAGQSGTWQFGMEVTSDQAGVVTAAGGGVVETTQTDFAVTNSYNNLASFSSTANLYGTATQYLTADGAFSVDATTTSVTLSLKVTSGTLTAKAGGFLRLIQIS